MGQNGRWWGPGQEGQSDLEKHLGVDLGFTERVQMQRPHLKFLSIILLVPLHGNNSSPTERLYSDKNEVLSTHLPSKLNRCIIAVKVYSENAGQVRDIGNTNRASS